MQHSRTIALVFLVVHVKAQSVQSPKAQIPHDLHALKSTELASLKAAETKDRRKIHIAEREAVDARKALKDAKSKAKQQMQLQEYYYQYAARQNIESAEHIAAEKAEQQIRSAETEARSAEKATEEKAMQEINSAQFDAAQARYEQKAAEAAATEAEHNVEAAFIGLTVVTVVAILAVLKKQSRDTNSLASFKGSLLQEGASAVQDTNGMKLDSKMSYPDSLIAA